MKQKERVDNPGSNGDHDDQAWLIHTKSLILDIFGPKSPEYNFINDFSFSILAKEMESRNQTMAALRAKRTRISAFLDNCIESLEHKKLYKPPIQNWLASRSNLQILGVLAAIIIPLIGGAFYLGHMLGSAGSPDTKLKQQLEDTRPIDSLSTDSTNDKS